MIKVTDDIVRQWTEYLAVALKPGSRASMEMNREVYPDVPSKEGFQQFQMSRVLTITIKIEQPE